jgi:uncharacterized protein (UPF0264 family)
MGQHVIRRQQNGGRPGLLVSVRDANEALAALDGGADVIDVKEPSRGPLGPADAATIGAVVQAVAGRAPVTAAAGELVDIGSAGPSWFKMLKGVSLFKIGLAGCALQSDWRERWKLNVESWRDQVRPVAVVYADWRAAQAIEPRTVLDAAVEFGCAALLIDTWDKSRGDLFDHWPGNELAAFVEFAQQSGRIVALAGSLSALSFREAAAIGPDIVAVRGAACDGGRTGRVSRRLVAALREVLVAECSAGAWTRC